MSNRMFEMVSVEDELPKELGFYFVLVVEVMNGKVGKEEWERVVCFGDGKSGRAEWSSDLDNAIVTHWLKEVKE